MLYLRFRRSLDAEEHLDALRNARDILDRYIDEPAPISGALRRQVAAASVHYSTRIEGNTLTLGQVESVLRGEQVSAPADQQQEVLNYAEAIEYAQDVATQTDGQLSEDTIRTIHFLVSKSLPGDYAPGRYRTIQNYVINSATDRSLYRPPPPTTVEPLMREYAEWLNAGHRDLAPYYRAALAHLNFVAIHPFNDGNGRTARLIEALVLYRAGYKSHELVSLEEFFGRDTRSYYVALSESLGPVYRPEDHDVTPWADYYLRAHAEQAIESAASLRTSFGQFEALEAAFAMDPSRTMAIWLACRHGAVANSTYRFATDVSNQTAARHLAAMADSGLLAREGRGRASRYVPTESALAVYRSASQTPDDVGN